MVEVSQVRHLYLLSLHVRQVEWQVVQVTPSGTKFGVRQVCWQEPESNRKPLRHYVHLIDWSDCLRHFEQFKGHGSQVLV